MSTISKIDNTRYPLHFHKVVIPSAEVLTLNTIPVTLARAPVPVGLALIPEKIIVTIGAGTAYATTTVLDISYTDESGEAIASTGAAFLANTLKKSQLLNIDQVAGADYITPNAAIVASVGGAIITGTADVTVEIWFHEMPI